MSSLFETAAEITRLLGANQPVALLQAQSMKRKAAASKLAAWQQEDAGRLKKLIEAAKDGPERMTVEALADRAAVGTPSFLSQLANAYRPVSFEHAIKLATALGVAVEEISPTHAAALAAAPRAYAGAAPKTADITRPLDVAASENLIEAAALKLGNQAKLAEAMGVTPQAIVKWKQGRIPAERVLDLERVSGIARHVLRPDLYPPEAAKPALKSYEHDIESLGWCLHCGYEVDWDDGRATVLIRTLELNTGQRVRLLDLNEIPGAELRMIEELIADEETYAAEVDSAYLAGIVR